MSLYLLHQQIVFLFLFFLNGINPYLHALVTFIEVALLSLGLATLLVQFRWTRLMVGEKNC